MGKPAVTEREEETLSAYYVDIPLEQRGKAAPPLYDGYRDLFANVATIALDEKRPRVVTEHIRNCAARILCYLNYQLARSEYPQNGVKYSRTDFQVLFRFEYGLDVIEVAQALLIGRGFVFPPEQDGSTGRAFYWKIDARKLREEFAQTKPSSKKKKRTGKRKATTKRPQLVLVVKEEKEAADESSHDPSQDESSVASGTSHAQNSRDGKGHNPASMLDISDEDAEASASAHGDTLACNTKSFRDVCESREDTHPPTLENGRIEGEAALSNGSALSPSTRSRIRILPPAYPAPERPESPELFLAVFDWLRGYKLPADLLSCAQKAADLLYYGDEEQQRPGYNRFMVEQTALYVRDHDPVWKENYQKWCSKTGIPDIWSIAKVIAAKWPLALKRLLESGEYLRLDDGTLLSRDEYEAHLEREQEAWRAEQHQREAQPLAEESLATDEVVTETTAADQAETVALTVAPSSTAMEEDQPEPAGWERATAAGLHAKRLVRVLPPYFQVEVQPVAEALSVIVITNVCAEDDTVVITCNKQVCSLLEVIRAENALDEQKQGWSIPAIAEWWAERFVRKLPPTFLVEVCPLEEERHGIVITNTALGAGEVIMLANNSQAEGVLAQLSGKGRQPIGGR